MIKRSTNCKRYTDSVSTLVALHAPGSEGCNADLLAFSCQKDAYERVDALTQTMLENEARDMLTKKGCRTDDLEFQYTTNLVGARSVELSAEKMSDTNMASNCFMTENDANHATHKVTARCTPQFDMTDDMGNRVRNTNMVFRSSLSACDVSNAAMPQLYEDARKVAAHNAKAQGYTVDEPEHLACVYAITPQI